MSHCDYFRQSPNYLEALRHTAFTRDTVCLFSESSSATSSEYGLTDSAEEECAPPVDMRGGNGRKDTLTRSAVAFIRSAINDSIAAIADEQSTPTCARELKNVNRNNKRTSRGSLGSDMTTKSYETVRQSTTSFRELEQRAAAANAPPLSRAERLMTSLDMQDAMEERLRRMIVVTAFTVVTLIITLLIYMFAQRAQHSQSIIDVLWSDFNAAFCTR